VSQPVTLDQLARLYAARNEANKRMPQAMRSKDATLIRLAKEDVTRWNYAYDDARKAYKRQQKAAQRERLRNTMIRYYMDLLDDETTHENDGRLAA
jgi:predicted lipid-binding transport protein (Tim44 family)